MSDVLLTSATSIHTLLLCSPLLRPSRAVAQAALSQRTAASPAPWQNPSQPHPDLAQPLRRWLEGLGWTDDGADESSPHGCWLHFSAGQVTLSASIARPDQSLDVTLTDERPIEASPEAVAKRTWLTRGSRFGILTNGQELRFFVFDNDCQWHAVVVRGHGRTNCHRLLPLELNAQQTIESLCSPEFQEQADGFLKSLRAHRARRLEELRCSIQVGLSSFLSALLTSSRDNPFSKDELCSAAFAHAIWREGLLLAYATLFVARAEMLNQPRLNNSLLGSAEWIQLYSPLSALIPRLSSLSQQEPSPDFAIRFKEMLLRATAFALEGRSATANCEQREPKSFPLLGRLDWPSSSCKDFLSALLLEPSFGQPESRTKQRCLRSLPTMTIQDIALLFESHLEHTPALAQVPMAKYRHGKHEIVVPQVAAPVVSARPTTHHGSTSQPKATKPIETVAPGQFYIAGTKGRKTAGAFYTPKALVEAVTNQALKGKLSTIAADDWASVLKVSVLDPAMGTGAFLLEASTQLGIALFERILTARKEPNRRCEALPGSPPTRSVPPPQELPAHLVCAINDWLLHNGAHPTDQGPHSHGSPTDALNHCAALCAQHCLYGVDLNALSAQLARIALWSASGCSESLALAVQQRLVAGNALTGPRVQDLFIHPQTGIPLDSPLREVLSRRCSEYFAHHVEPSTPPPSARSATSTLGCTALHSYANAWAKAVGLYPQSHASTTESLLRLLTAKLDDGEHQQLAEDTDGLCFELAFPERFHFKEQQTSGGFDVILGNPPWDSVKHNTREVLARFDLRAVTVSTKPERDALTLELHEQGVLTDALENQVAAYERAKLTHDRLYRHQKTVIDGDLAGRQLDLFRLFLERSWGLLAEGGVLGMVVPSAFHTAAGAVGVRRLIFASSTQIAYAVLSNERRWFDISPGLQFGLLIAQAGQAKAGTLAFRFDLKGPESLLCDSTAWLSLPLRHFLDSNPYATIPSIASHSELELVCAAECSGIRMVDFGKTALVDLRSTPTSVHRTHEAKHFVKIRSGTDPRRQLPTAQQLLEQGAMLHEGATFARYDDTWGDPPVYAMAPERLLQVSRWRSSVGFYRVVVRAIVGASPHKGIAALIAPGTLAANSALVEGQPQARPNFQALVALAVLNSSTANYLLSTTADLNINLFALRRLPWPKRLPQAFIAHTVLRLVTNHPGFLPLWQEQLGPDIALPPPSSMPVVAPPAARMALQGVLDAVVATAYGMTRAQYHLVLSRLGDEQGYRLGAASYDELAADGEQAFVERQDPHSAISLCLSLPQPLVSL